MDSLTKQHTLAKTLQLGQERWQLALEASQEGVCDWDVENGVVYYSPRWEAMFGYKTGEAPQIPETFVSHIHPDDVEEAVAEMYRGFKREFAYYTKEFRMSRLDGTLLWTLHRATYIFNNTGRVVRVVGTTLDISDRKKAKEAEALWHAEVLKHQQILLQLSSLPLGMRFDEKLKTIIRQTAITLSCERVSVWKLDDGGASLTADYIYKLSTDEYLPGLSLYQKDFPLYFSRLAQNAHITANDAHTDPATVEFSAGYLAPIGISSMLDIPILEGEKVVGVICHEHVGAKRSWTENEQGFARSVSNIVSLAFETERRREAEEKLIKSQINFEEAQEIAHLGSWEFDFASNDLRWSKEMFRLFELEGHPSESLYEAFRSKIYPEDLANLDKCIQRSLETGESYLIEERVACRDGSTRYLACIGEPIRDLDGHITGLRGTSQDVTPHKQAALAKSEFLSIMSHEIRTPINGVIGIANLLMEENLTDMQREYVHTLNFSAQHLLNIVSDILDFSKIESGNLHFEKEHFDLEEVCHHVYKLYKNMAAEKNIEYHFSPSKLKDYVFIGDVVRLNQILTNLLSNAIKFTEKGRVDFEYRVKSETGDRICMIFVVKDTGIGVDALQQEKIFEYFQQGNEPVSRKHGGTGLGLAISKKLVELQGGKIFVESKSGEGATFTVELEFGKSVRSAAANPEIPASDLPTEEMLPGMKILLAEDHDVNALVVIRLLNKWQIKTSWAKDGQEALKHLEKEDFDLVLMDIWMPNMSGLDALKAIRRSDREHLRHMPVIAFTADASRDSLREFIESGFNECITKPFNPGHLFELLKKYATVSRSYAG